MRPAPAVAARHFIATYFPEAEAAVVGGSAIRGDSTPTSDLDITLITRREDAPFRWSTLFEGWPVEVFVHTLEAYAYFSESDVQRRQPTIHMLWAEGLLLRDENGLGTRLKERGAAILVAGPPPLPPDEIEMARYFITDLIDDLLGGGPRAEMLMVAQALAGQAIDLRLGLHRAWSGKGKWVIRALRRHNAAHADQISAALETFARADDPGPLIAFVDAVLAEVGGRLFAGYRVSAKEQIAAAKRAGWEPESPFE